MAETKLAKPHKADSTASDAASFSASMLTQLTLDNKHDVLPFQDTPLVPAPVLPETLRKQGDCTSAMASWEVLQGTLDTSLSHDQQHARTAQLPSIAKGSEHESWTALMQQHASSAKQLNHMEQSTDDTIKADAVELTASIKQSIMYTNVVSEPSILTLAEPLLQLSALAEGLLPQLFSATTKPKMPRCMAGSIAQCSVMGSCQSTFHTLVAQDMTLQDSVCTFPLVIFDDSTPHGTDEAESKVNAWQQCMADCHIRQVQTKHLGLYIDWSLSDRSSTSPKSLQEYKRRVGQALHPAVLPPVEADSALDDMLSPESLISSIARLTAVPCGVLYNAVEQPEQLPHAVQARLQSQAQHAKQAQHPILAQRAQQAQPAKQAQQAHQHPELSKSLNIDRLAGSTQTRSVPDASMSLKPTQRGTAVLPSTSAPTSSPLVQPERPSADKQSTAQPAPATGVFQKPQSHTMSQRSSVQQQGTGGNDMAFFLGLQQGPASKQPNRLLGPSTTASAAGKGPAPGPSKPAPAAEQPHVVDLCTDSSQEEAEVTCVDLPDVQYSVLRLPERHEGLLQLMREEHAAVLRQHASIDADVSCSTLPSLLCQFRASLLQICLQRHANALMIAFSGCSFGAAHLQPKQIIIINPSSTRTHDAFVSSSKTQLYFNPCLCHLHCHVLVTCLSHSCHMLVTCLSAACGQLACQHSS